MLSDFKTIFRENRSLLWLWPVAWGLALLLVFVFEEVWGPGGAGLRARHTIPIAYIVSVLVVAPLLENNALVLIVWIAMLVRPKPNGASVVVGAVSGLAHAYINNYPNGVFAAIFFFLMARIYVTYRHGPLRKSAFWFTVAMHFLNNALVVGALML